ncbi:hypothetical protein K438DRAFT_1796214, partial [Mycena galopus ATCC 62051]
LYLGLIFNFPNFHSYTANLCTSLSSKREASFGGASCHMLHASRLFSFCRSRVLLGNNRLWTVHRPCGCPSQTPTYATTLSPTIGLFIGQNFGSTPIEKCCTQCTRITAVSWMPSERVPPLHTTESLLIHLFLSIPALPSSMPTTLKRYLTSPLREMVEGCTFRSHSVPQCTDSGVPGTKQRKQQRDSFRRICSKLEGTGWAVLSSMDCGQADGVELVELEVLHNATYLNQLYVST